MSQFRKKTLSEALRCEYYRMDKSYLIILPVTLLLLGIFTRWASGSPIATLHYIGVRQIVPPTWLMILLFSIFYLVAGLSLGIALGNRFCSCGEKKYQGAMWFCICLALGYAWYPIFFCARLFLISLIVSLLCLFAGGCASICFSQVSRSALTLSVIYDLWLLYLAFLNLQIFFTV